MKSPSKHSVFLVTREPADPYEVITTSPETVIVGVFSTEEKAQRWLERLEDADRELPPDEPEDEGKDEGEYHGGWNYDILERVVDEPGE